MKVEIEIEDGVVPEGYEVVGKAKGVEVSRDWGHSAIDLRLVLRPVQPKEIRLRSFRYGEVGNYAPHFKLGKNGDLIKYGYQKEWDKGTELYRIVEDGEGDCDG
jgi:hypothetical protein